MSDARRVKKTYTQTYEHPGVFLKAAIDEQGLSVAEVSLRSKVNFNELKAIIDGNKNLTPKTSKALGAVLNKGGMFFYIKQTAFTEAGGHGQIIPRTD